MPELSDREMADIQAFIRESRTFQASMVAEQRATNQHLATLNGSVAHNTARSLQNANELQGVKNDISWLRTLRLESEGLEKERIAHVTIAAEKADELAEKAENRIFDWIKANAVTGLLLLGLIVNILLSLKP